MASTAHEADVVFRLTLDQALATTTFPPGSVASNVEQKLNAAIEKHQQASDTSFHKFFRHLVAARTIRGVLSAWRKQVPVGEEAEPGYLVDKFDYGYDAVHSIRPKNNEPDSLEYQLVGCMTGEFKRYRELKVELLQDVVNGASKVYLNLTRLMDNAGEKSEQAAEGLDQENEPETATYTAVLNEPPSPPKTRQRKRAPDDLEDDQLPALPKDESTASPAAKRKKPSFKPQTQRTLAPASGSPQPPKSATEPPKKKGTGMGNYKHGPVVPWQPDEDYYAQQQIRADSSLVWGALVSKINSRFEGTYFTHPKTGLTRRGPRTVHGVRQRFVKFKREMQERDDKGLLRRGTESDVEPEESHQDGQYDEASVQGSEDDSDVDAWEIGQDQQRRPETNVRASKSPKFHSTADNEL